jgi:hypothetical protein
MRARSMITARAFIFILAAVLSWGCVKNTDQSKGSATTAKDNIDISHLEFTVFKTPLCGCCKLYIDYLKENGASVQVVEKPDIAPIKRKYKISENMQSCHTARVGEYFIEGHVPIEAVKKLITEKPDLDGIALPGMPSGAPGMPSSKNDELVIYGVVDGNATVFLAQ